MPKPQQIYRHFKGGLYQIISLAEHTESGEELVIYQALYGDFRIYARPLSMFMERVDRKKYPEASQEYRFELVETEKEAENGQEEREQERKEEIRAESAGDISEEPLEESGIDPLVLQFLDADSYSEKLDILAALHSRITDSMINTCAIAIDVEVAEGDIEERYEELRRCLLLYDKFECTRLR